MTNLANPTGFAIAAACLQVSKKEEEKADADKVDYSEQIKADSSIKAEEDTEMKDADGDIHDDKPDSAAKGKSESEAMKEEEEQKEEKQKEVSKEEPKEKMPEKPVLQLHGKLSTTGMHSHVSVNVFGHPATSTRSDRNCSDLASGSVSGADAASALTGLEICGVLTQHDIEGKKGSTGFSPQF